HHVGQLEHVAQPKCGILPQVGEAEVLQHLIRSLFVRRNPVSSFNIFADDISKIGVVDFKRTALPGFFFFEFSQCVQCNDMRRNNRFRRGGHHCSFASSVSDKEECQHCECAE